ncbi:hypothetical protein SXIM_52690 [Streptomyces xiamenensis]|uniref:Uncharacterized protein n=1 Tax=Streptomyces xiamenensis TaxID=408015 RepID=A0A0F7G1I3_9ACTN|nr:hypothetical protein SXIM_52690 [Streptomyces xiamenensis]
MAGAPVNRFHDRDYLPRECVLMQRWPGMCPLAKRAAGRHVTAPARAGCVI